MPAPAPPAAKAPIRYCDDCGQPIGDGGGKFEFFYANERADKPMWYPPGGQFVCATHKGFREQAGHTARVPV